MKTLAEAWELIDYLNEQAHSDAWDSWVAADEMEESDDEDSEETAEQLREEASNEQAGYFRESYWELAEEDREAIKHWLTKDNSFRYQFVTWFGYEAFEDEKENDD
jgi:hypothetical protein